MLTAAETAAYIDARLTRSAFRLELLDRYDVAADGVDFQRFLRGEAAPTMERKQPWLDRLRAERDAGIVRHRVHILARPLTDYLRYECEWGYVPNVAAGEDIRILDLTGRRDAQGYVTGLTPHDFWLIDDQYPIVMHYDNAGRFLGAEPDHEGLAPRYRYVRSIAVHAAEPFTAWWAEHPEEHRTHQAA